jgi:hypothetical protein
MGSAVSLNIFSTMSPFEIDGLIFKRVSFTSIAVKNGIIGECIRKSILGEILIITFFAMDFAVAIFAGEGVFV